LGADRGVGGVGGGEVKYIIEKSISPKNHHPPPFYNFK